MVEVVFQSHPEVEIVTNKFFDVPTIIQFEELPLLQVGRFVEAGFTTKFHVFHSDGTDIAVVKGSQLYLTEGGRNANVRLIHEPGLTACELEGRQILELRRIGAAALKGWAELYATEGILLKASDSGVSGLLRSGEVISLEPGLTMSGSNIQGASIGIHYTRETIAVGVGAAFAGLHFEGNGKIRKPADAKLIQRIDIPGGGTMELTESDENLGTIIERSGAGENRVPKRAPGQSK